MDSRLDQSAAQAPKTCAADICVLGDDETCGLDGGQDRILGEAVLKPTGRRSLGGRRSAAKADIPDPRGMTRFNWQDAAGTRKHRFRLDVRDLAEVRMDTGVLEYV